MAKRKKKRKSRSRSITSSSPSIPNTTTAPENPNLVDLPNLTSTLLAGAISALTSFAIAKWLPEYLETPGFFFTFGFCLLAVTYLARNRIPRRPRIYSMTAIAGATLFALIWGIGAVPSSDERRVAQYFSDICSDPMWGTEPVLCMDRSREFASEHVSDYFTTWGTVTRPTRGEVVSLDTLSQGSDLYSGGPVTTIGEVVGMQSLGGNELVIQVRPATREALSNVSWRTFQQTLGPENYMTELFPEPRPTAEKTANSLVYINVTVRPFFSIKPGQLLIIQGIAVATGRILQPASQHVVPMTYIRARAIERSGP